MPKTGQDEEGHKSLDDQPLISLVSMPQKQMPSMDGRASKIKKQKPRSSGSPLMGQPVRGLQDRQAPPREVIPLGVQRCGRRSQDSSLLDFMVARTPASELSRRRLAVSALWIFATAPKLQNDRESSARKSLYQQPPIILASAIRPYIIPDQVPPGRTTNIRPRGNVDSTPGLDPRVQCIQPSLCSRWMHSFTLPSLHDRNISHYREVLARHGTQQYSWLCCTVRVRLTTTPAHTSGIPSPPPSGSSLLRGPAQLSLAMVPSPSSKRKSSRRLPSYLKNQVGAEPVGELRRLREEAANAAIERDRLHQEPSQPSQPSAGARQAKTRGRGEGGKRFPQPGLSIGAGAGNDEPEHPIESHGPSSSSSRKRLLAEPDEAQTGRAKTRGWGEGGKRFPRPGLSIGVGAGGDAEPEQPQRSHGPSSSSSRKRPLEEPDDLAQDGAGTIAAAERPALKSRKQDKSSRKGHVPCSGREAQDRPRGGHEPSAASRPADSAPKIAVTEPKQKERLRTQDRDAPSQEAVSALAGVTMTQRREKLISHKLSRILRHEAPDHDLPMNFCRLCPNPRRGYGPVFVEPPSFTGGGSTCRPDQQEAALRDQDGERGGMHKGGSGARPASGFVLQPVRLRNATTAGAATRSTLRHTRHLDQELRRHKRQRARGSTYTS